MERRCVIDLSGTTCVLELIVLFIQFGTKDLLANNP